MEKKGEYSISDIYGNSYSTFKSSASEIGTGYHLATGRAGAPTNPTIANQVQDVFKLLNQGIIPVEIGTLDPDVFDQIPKNHFAEIRRMAKLAGAKLSVHAPILKFEPSGINNGKWSEENREYSEHLFRNVIDKTAQNLSDPKVSNNGRVNIVMHAATSTPGTEWKIGKDSEGNRARVVENFGVIDQTNGEIGLLPVQPQYIPGQEAVKGKLPGKLMNPEQRIEQYNRETWDRSIASVSLRLEEANRIVDQEYPKIKALLESGIDPAKTQLDSVRETFYRYENAKELLHDAKANMDALFQKAYKYVSEDEKKILVHASNEFRDDLGKIQIDPEAPNRELFKKTDTKEVSFAMQKFLDNLKKVQPQQYKPLTEFSMEKSAETFANAALYGLKQYGDKAPVLAIENLFPGAAFSMGDEMEALIKQTREKFVEKAKREGYSDTKARAYADELIGITFDVGHLNMARKKGFETADLLKETKRMAPYVKHLHLTDNFGFSDSHLPPGMGNVPTKEMLEILEATGFKGNAIVEAGGFVQQFQTSPLPYTLEGLGSPMYRSGTGPYWSDTSGLQRGYFAGQGMTLPQVHYETFGSGFSQLPQELGGSRLNTAAGSRLSGNGLE